MVVAEITITPVGSEDMRPFVDAAVEEIRKTGLKYEVEAMGTTVEGDLDQVFDALKSAHNAVKNKGADRVLTEIRIDDKVEEKISIEGQVSGYRSSM